MKRNYESLMEASQHLQKTLTKHGENKKGNQALEKCSVKSAETVRSLQNMKSQALASLVIRKNVIKPKKGKKPPEKVSNNLSKDGLNNNVQTASSPPPPSDDSDDMNMKVASI